MAGKKKSVQKVKVLRKLKLFVWEGVLTDYTSGAAWALARTAEEAKAEVQKVLTYHGDGWDGVKLDGVEPKVYDKPAGFYVYGGG